MAKIKRYNNGDTCPCCGQVIEGKTREWLDLFSFVDLENPGVHDTIRKAGQFLRLIGTEAET